MTTSESLADVISAASLVLAVLAALYAYWLPRLSEARELEIEDDPDDRGPQRRSISAAIVSKALPLALATLAASAILLPRGVAIVCETWTKHSVGAFDDVKALFMLTLCLIVMLAIASTFQLISLIKKRIEL